MRAQALAWWRKMPRSEQERLAIKHRPNDNWTFEMVSASSSIIERIYFNEELT